MNRTTNPQCVAIVVLACYCLVTVSSNSSAEPQRYNSAAATPSENQISYKTLYFESQLDHFDFYNTLTFKLRYLVNDQYWDKNGGPILFYTGNEMDITLICNNTGFMWENAPGLKAMIVFAEHRYYGETLPFGVDTHKNPANLRFLSSEQALADYAELIRHIKNTVDGAVHSKVVAIGGSYGGALAAWFRMKYPNVVVGALASGASLMGFKGLTKCNAFPDYTTYVWKKTSPVCAKNINLAYQTMDNMAGEDKGLQSISDIFSMCTPMKTDIDLFEFKALLTYMYVNYAWMNYPYPVNFMANLPAWPIRAACKYLSEPLQGKELLSGLNKVINMFYNSTGDMRCLDVQKSLTGGRLQVPSYLYQACTELSWPMCSDGTGVYLKMENVSQILDGLCQRLYKVKPRPDWGSLQFWGHNLKAASNIIFCEGDLDPTIVYGVNHDVSDSVVSIMVKDGAHNLDLRWRNKEDPLSVKIARQKELHIIRKWLKN